MFNNKLLELVAEHMIITQILTLLWLCWVAFILGMIYWELRSHNNRAEQADYREQFKREKDRS